MKNKILILGKIPPPIGGVTIHVQRLLSRLESDALSFKFLGSTKNIILLIRELKNFRALHLHSSSPYYRLLIVLLGEFCNTKTIVTIHGDLGRFNSAFKNTVDSMAVRFCTLPIVLNKGSYDKAVKLNSKVKLITAFIPPLNRQELSTVIEDKLSSFSENYQLTFSTNAFNRTIDKNGDEIYGIEMLIPLFTKHSDYALIISDPSGAYSEYFKDQNITVPINIHIINYPHSYFEILDRVDVSIRNTSTDGDPLSIKESLFLGTPVIASNVVSRHSDCILYSRDSLSNDFETIIELLKSHTINSPIKDGSIEIFKLYQQFFGNI